MELTLLIRQIVILAEIVRSVFLIQYIDILNDTFDGRFADFLLLELAKANHILGDFGGGFVAFQYSLTM